MPHQQAGAEQPRERRDVEQVFCVGTSDDGGVTRLNKFDDKPYDVIVFDEIYFASVHMLAKVKRYSELNPNKIILATGDTDQLEAIDLVSDRINCDAYMNHCVDTIFPHNVLLKENKRLKTEHDKRCLAMLKQDIFNEAIPIKNTLQKYFHSTKLTKTENKHRLQEFDVRASGQVGAQVYCEEDVRLQYR